MGTGGDGRIGERLGFIGLGVMGAPMAANLVRAEPPALTVYDVRPELVAALVARGAVDGGSVAGTVDRADIVMLSLPDGPTLDRVMTGTDGVLDRVRPGQLIVDHTTAPVALTRELGARVRERGADYCDAPIARTRQAAHDGTLSIMVGGAPAAVERLMPVLAPMASDVTHCGDLGAGQITKLLNNMILFQNVQALAEAHAIAGRLGVDSDLVFDVIGGASGGSFALHNHGRKAMFVDTYPDDAFGVDYARKDLSYALELAREVGVEVTGAEATRDLLDRASEAGFHREYFPVVRRLL
ncbi:MAG: NAD(P)-dependent oxidoreductase [Acidimicrobiales bacterium]